MDRNSIYYKQVQLLLRVLPLITEEDCFALKGGTAINLFVRDFPRLSVDIDLVYLPKGSRKEALSAVSQALNRIATSIENTLSPADAIRNYLDKPDALRLLVRKDKVTIKIEVSPVLRGTVYAPTMRPVAPSVEDEFGYAAIKVVALEDLYAGKLCAAFDRQHARDFFDVLLLSENEGITDGIRKAFVVYLASHQRPMEELLAPNWSDPQTTFQGEFQGMTSWKTDATELLAAGQSALKNILSDMTAEEKRFLYSLYEGKPEWAALRIPGLEDLPALKWKMTNIQKMVPLKRRGSLARLKNILESAAHK